VYKWDYIAKKARLVLDTRNAVNGAGLGNVYKL
jgi:hypothetical protein